MVSVHAEVKINSYMHAKKLLHGTQPSGLYREGLQTEGTLTKHDSLELTDLKEVVLTLECIHGDNTN